MPIHVMAMDPGFRTFGVAIIEVGKDYEKVVCVDVIRTEPSKKKLKVLSSTDDDRRVREITGKLVSLDLKYKATIFTSEERANVRSASSSAKVAIGWTIPVVLGAIRDVPLIQQSPQDLKLKTVGKKTATKADIMKAMEEMFPGQFEEFKKKYPPQNPGKPAGAWEHGYDAVASYVASKDEQILQMARSMMR